MKFKKLCTSLAIAVSFLFGATSASATTIGECDSLINVVDGQLAGTEINSRNADKVRAKLEAKLDNASIKLNQAKFADSIQKLTDFSYTIQDMAVANMKGVSKVSAEDAAVLVQSSNEASACVGELML